LRTWIFLRHAEHCGLCHALIPLGSAAHEISLHGVTRKKYRGECCAGPAPPQLPDAPVLQPPPQLDLSRIAALIPVRTRGALKGMAREYLPHADD
jgi:hypothetical protein